MVKVYTGLRSRYGSTVNRKGLQSYCFVFLSEDFSNYTLYVFALWPFHFVKELFQIFCFFVDLSSMKLFFVFLLLVSVYIPYHPHPQDVCLFSHAALFFSLSVVLMSSNI